MYKDFTFRGGTNMSNNSYKIGKSPSQWKDGMVQVITFIVTEDCNLRCKYCYITHKASNKKMNFDIAKKFIDYILVAPIHRQDAVIIEFIGGEPFLEVELIDQISDYFKIKTFECGNEWYWNYIISICTNGVNYSDDKVQNFIKKNYGKLSISITIDGTKEKHDLQRVFPNGDGSYDIIKKNIGLWLNQFKGSTKVTFSSDDLFLLKDSIIQLWLNGITEVSANVVFENVWKEGDDLLFENQLKELANYVLDNKLFSEYVCTLFDDTIGQPYTKSILNMTSCGSGKMIAVGTDGKLYPCIRYNEYSLNNKDAYIIGDVEKGIDFDRVRPFGTLMHKYQSDTECINCKVATGCLFCQGFNYDEADTYTNFQRAKYICKMHKARVRANNYYFAKLSNQYNIERCNYNNETLKLKFILDDNYVTICSYSNQANNMDTGKIMDKNCILKGLQYAHENFMKPVFIHSNNTFDFELLDKYKEFRILHILPAQFFEMARNFKEYLLVFDKNNLSTNIPFVSNSILNVEYDDVRNLAEYVILLFDKTDRINLNIINYNITFDLDEYEKQLVKIKDYLSNLIKNDDKIKELNVLTDILFLNEHVSCNAGVDSFAFCPDGKLYICQSFYSEHSNEAIGNLLNGMMNFKNPHLLSMEYAPICNVCDAFQCENCIFRNKKHTNEVNISPAFQCYKSHVERKVSQILKQEIENKIPISNKLNTIRYDDPYSNLIDENYTLGYYDLMGRK
jgi:radical SAM peptide maturase (CXXX-repeat target family)/CXXX repeat peptide maturase